MIKGDNMNWEESLFLDGKEEIANHFGKLGSLLLILGIGFDPRTCKIAEIILGINPNVSVWVVDYQDEGLHNNANEESSRRNYQRLVDLCKGSAAFKRLTIPMYKLDGYKKTLTIYERVKKEFTTEKINIYKNIIVDVSAMPRGVSFSILKRLLSIRGQDQRINIAVCENSEYDDAIVPVIVEESAEYLPGFNTFSMSLEQDESETIWFPVLGMSDTGTLKIISDYIKPIEICPIIPFPSKDVTRGERILRSCGETLFREMNVEKRNIIYVPENNPLLVYRKLFDTVNYYERALKIVTERTTKYAFSSQSSKMIDVGVLLAIIQLSQLGLKTGIVIVENQGYTQMGDYCEGKESVYCLCLHDNVFEW